MNKTNIYVSVRTEEECKRAYEKIELHGIHGAGKFAIVDKADYENVSKFKWFSNSDGYAIRTFRKNKTPRSITMHRFILNYSGNLQIDHINHDKLDNRRSNLRICTHSQNQANRTGCAKNKKSCSYVGVFKRWGKYVAALKFKGKVNYIGIFKTPEEAALAYNLKSKELRGEFGFINKIPNNPTT